MWKCPAILPMELRDQSKLAGWMEHKIRWFGMREELKPMAVTPKSLVYSRTVNDKRLKVKYLNDGLS